MYMYSIIILFRYLRYVNLCSKALRACLKPELASIAIKREECGLKYAIWDNGKQGDLSKYHVNLIAFIIFIRNCRNNIQYKTRADRKETTTLRYYTTLDISIISIPCLEIIQIPGKINKFPLYQ